MFTATFVILAFASQSRLDADGIALPPEALRRFGSARFCTEPLRSVAFSPGGKTLFALAAGTKDYPGAGPRLAAWEVTTGRRIWGYWGGRFGGQKVVISLDGKSLWVIGRTDPSSPQRGEAIRLKVDARTGEELERKDLATSWSNACVLLPDGTLYWNRYDVKANDLTVRVLRPDGTDELAWDPEGHAVGLLVLAPNGKTLYVGGRAFDTAAWKLTAVDVATKKAKWTVDTAMQDTLAVSPDGKVIAMTVSGDPPPKGPRPQYHHPEMEDPKATRLVGRHAATGEEFGAVFVGNDYFRRFQRNPPYAGRPLRFSSDGTQLFTLDDRSKTVTVSTDKWVADPQVRNDLAVGGWPNSDGKTYFLADYGYNLRQFNAATHAEIVPPPVIPPKGSRDEPG